jgi:hypothetical protein
MALKKCKLRATIVNAVVTNAVVAFWRWCSIHLSDLRNNALDATGPIVCPSSGASGVVA